MTRLPFPYSILFILCTLYLGIGLCGGIIGVPFLAVALGYTSIALLVVMSGVGLLKFRFGLLQGCSGAMVLFYVLLVFAGVFSNDIFNSLKWKTVGFCTLLAGISLGRTIIDIEQFRKDMRILLIPLTMGALIMLKQAILEGGGSRLDIMGNPNATAIIAASAFCIAAYLAIWDSTKMLRIVSIPTTVALGIALIATGSRASAGAAVMACLILAFPLLKRPGRLVLVSLLAIAAIWFLLDKVDIEKAVARITSLEKDTGRLALWAEKFDFNKNWLFGNGGVIEYDIASGRAAWPNMHSIYLQIVFELGYCGAFVFVLVFLYALKKSVRLMLRCAFPEKWLAFALMALPMGIGLFESLPLLGGSIITVWWGMGFGLLDGLDCLQKEAALKKKAERRVDIRTLGKFRFSLPKA